jgi:hypothetical protein
MHKRDVPESNVSLKEAYIVFYEDIEQPVTVTLEDQTFLPIFSTIEKLEEQLPIISPEFPTKIKKVTDFKEFFNSVGGKIRLMLDPYVINGNTRFTELRPRG